MRSETAERLGTPEFSSSASRSPSSARPAATLAETLANLADRAAQARADEAQDQRDERPNPRPRPMDRRLAAFHRLHLIWWINFHYMSAFFTDPTGCSASPGLVGGGMCWMGIGAFIMAKMVSFEI
jgi:tight adherence protein B